MGFRLKTSKKTKKIFEELGKSTNLKPFALSKLSIALSLTDENPIDNYTSDTNGLELNRQTITAQYDTIYKALMQEHANKHLTDDEYFPTHTKLHIDRGAEMLKNKYVYSTNLENFITQILKGDLGV
ncbi:DndE family protein [Tepidibacter sp. Z1-5]|uniref:DndE family protein n=1 Tax=Tepidibacter sp. Z1-5 TaxID=3134138 RepID=UPI0030C0D62E